MNQLSVKFQPTRNEDGWQYVRVEKTPFGLFRIFIQRTNSKYSENVAELSKWSDHEGWLPFETLDHTADYLRFDPTVKEMNRGVRQNIDFTPFVISADALMDIANRFFG